MSTPSSPRQRRKQARPQELLDAALELFVEKGFAATRAEEVAARAGVSKGTLYLYYPSKEELLKAVIRQHLSTVIADGAMQVEQFKGSAATFLVERLSAWWQHVYDSPASGVIKVVFTESRGFPDIAEFYVQEVIEPGERLIGALVRHGMDSGEFRQADVGNVVHSLVLPMILLCLNKHSIGPCAEHELAPDPHRFIREHVELVTQGLLAHPTQPGAAGRPA